MFCSEGVSVGFVLFLCAIYGIFLKIFPLRHSLLWLNCVSSHFEF